MSLGGRLRQLRGKTSQEATAKAVGLTRSAYSLYELDMREPDYATLVKLAEYHGVTTDYLLGKTDDRQGRAPAPKTPSPDIEDTNRPGRLTSLPLILTDHKGAMNVQTLRLVTVPILGRIKAGVPLLSEENREGDIEVPEHLKGKTQFALRVSGDSMTGAGIQAGDIVFLRMADRHPPAHGNIVAAMRDEGEMTLKRYIKQNGRYWLHAENPAYEDLPVDERVQIQGTYVGRWTEHEGTVEPPVEDMTRDELLTKLAQLEGMDPDDLAEAVEFVRKLKRK